ncbi:MAG: cytochrome c biogenesis CcdA family protein [Acidimicrobiales bacterium]
MIDVPFALAFTAGLVGVVNPCGFAMLPAYLSFFLGVDGGDVDTTRASLSRALAVGLAVSAGFVACFGVIGLVVSHITREIYEWSPWLSVAIGLVLAALGVALLLGWELKVRLPRLDRGGGSGGYWSMAGYGVAYATVSLGCTLPVFLSFVAGTLTTENLLSGVLTFGAYAAGFTLLLTALTVTLAVARTSLVRALRRVLPLVQRISGALLVVAGLYVAYYGRFELRDDIGGDDPFVDRVTGWSADIQRWVQDTGASLIGLILALVIAAAAVYVASRRRPASRA